MTHIGRFFPGEGVSFYDAIQKNPVFGLNLIKLRLNLTKLRLNLVKLSFLIRIEAEKPLNFRKSPKFPRKIPKKP